MEGQPGREPWEGQEDRPRTHRPERETQRRWGSPRGHTPSHTHAAGTDTGHGRENRTQVPGGGQSWGAERAQARDWRSLFGGRNGPTSSCLLLPVCTSSLGSGEVTL